LPVEFQQPIGKQTGELRVLQRRGRNSYSTCSIIDDCHAGSVRQWLGVGIGGAAVIGVGLM
jgi:hypothetical protein